MWAELGIIFGAGVCLYEVMYRRSFVGRLHLKKDRSGHGETLQSGAWLSRHGNRED